MSDEKPTGPLAIAREYRNYDRRANEAIHVPKRPKLAAKVTRSAREYLKKRWDSDEDAEFFPVKPGQEVKVRLLGDVQGPEPYYKGPQRRAVPAKVPDCPMCEAGSHTHVRKQIRVVDEGTHFRELRDDERHPDEKRFWVDTTWYEKTSAKFKRKVMATEQTVTPVDDLVAAAGERVQELSRQRRARLRAMDDGPDYSKADDEDEKIGERYNPVYDCAACAGTGLIAHIQCQSCLGTGKADWSETAEKPACECGATACGSLMHSHYCPLADET